MKNVLELAARLGRKLVFFDIEHTGGSKEQRRIIEFGAYVVDVQGQKTTYSTLVSVPRDTHFNSHAMKANKIARRELVGKPTWNRVYEDFVENHLDGLWIGFNSKHCDSLIIRSECLRSGLEEPQYQELDLMRSSVIGAGLKGSLSERLKKVDPRASIDGMHRALKDAWMTMALLDGLLNHSRGAVDVLHAHLVDQEAPFVVVDVDAQNIPPQEIPYQRIHKNGRVDKAEEPIRSIMDVVKTPSVEGEAFDDKFDLDLLPAIVGNQIRRRFQEGAGLDELAKIAGCTRSALLKYLVDCGISPAK